MITIEEVKERRLEAMRIACESSILRQWYYSLGTTLAEQPGKTPGELDFSASWIVCPSELLHYLREGGVSASFENVHEVVIAFIEELIGDQLEEYRVRVEYSDMRNRFYLMKNPLVSS